MKLTHDSSHQHEAWIAGARRQFELAAAQRSGGAGKARSSDAGSSAAATISPFNDTGLPRLAGYRVVREVRRGGQGVVYEGVQERTGRTVALKVMRGGQFAGRADLLRFDREVHILSQLNHRNIVGVLDRGDVGGSQFLVMDFIDGLPLDRYARDECDCLEDRLRLFAEVCDAVSAAHQRGVIHRDLKPGNILVDPSGQPHILDFGLAMWDRSPDQSGDRSHSDEGMTRTGQFVGSLPWASPEQALGRHAEVDVRSDVYSLGIILYQLITERLPYSTVGDLDAVLSNIREAEPDRPRDIARGVSDDLETIVLKSLSKEPSRRYQSVGELARDIRHYLADEPVEAKRDSLGYVLRKSLGRHRAAVSMAGLFLVIIVAAAAISTSAWRRAAHDRDQAVAARRQESAARSLADDETGKAKSVNDFLQKMLASADPALSQGRDLTVREVVEDAARSVDRGTLSARPAVEAAVRMTLARSFISLARFDEAQRQLDVATQLTDRLYGTSSEPYAEVIYSHGVLERHRDHFQQAEQWQRQALALFSELHPDGSPMVAHSLAELAWIVESAGRRDESATLTAKAVEILRRTSDPHNPEVAILESLLASRTNDHHQAVDLAERSAAALREIYGDDHPDVAQAVRHLAGARFASADYQAAEKDYQDAIALFRKIMGDANPDTLSCVNDLSFLYQITGQREKGFQLLQEFLPAADAAFGPLSRYRVAFLIESAAMKKKAGDLAASESDLRQALEIAKEGGFSETAQGLTVRLMLSSVLLDRRACDEAAPLVEECRVIAEGLAGGFTPATAAQVKLRRGELLACQGHFAQAEPFLVEAIDGLMGNRLVTSVGQRKAMEIVVHFYESWDAAEPNTGKAEKAAEWRAKLPPANTPPS